MLRYLFSTWANPLKAGHWGLLAELTSVILVPQVVAVLHCGNLPSMSDGKRKGQGRGGTILQFFRCCQFLMSSELPTCTNENHT